MRRAACLLGALAVLASACSRLQEDEERLRAALSRAQLKPRQFRYVEVDARRAFAVEGEVADDFRYRLGVSSPRGRILEVVVVDDAIAIRAPQPEVLAGVEVSFGHPTLDEALRKGTWLVDPAGAPPLQPAQQAQPATQLAPPDPIQAALGALQTVITDMGQARQVRRFSEEDIEYKPSEDPFVYPDKARGELRYDLRPPLLPKREDQLQAPGGAGDVNEAFFRKLSVFVDSRRNVRRICEVVDVAGHEEFRRLRQRPNRFLSALRKRVLEGKTPTPIRPRSVMVDFSYPSQVDIPLPQGLTVRLDSVSQVLGQLFSSLLPAGDWRVDACRRRGTPPPP